MGTGIAPELIYGQEFYVPATANYYPYESTGVEAPVKWDDYQTFLGLDGQDLHYSGLQTEGSQYVYYAAPDYGYAHSSYSPYPLNSSFELDGSFVGAQEYLADAPNPAYHQTVPSPYYGPVVLPSATDGVLVSKPLLYTSVPFIPSKPSEAVKATNPLIPSTTPVSSRKGVISNPSLQSTIVSSKQFQDPAKLPKVPMHSSFPVRQQSAGEAMVSANHPRAAQYAQASEHLLHGRIPSAGHSSKANLSGNNGFGYVGSDLSKWVSAEKFHPSPKSSGVLADASRRLHLSSEQNLGRANRPRGQRTSAIIVESYSSKLRISNPEGKIILRTDEYNKDDFRMEYPYAKFFVIKSFSEDDIHKSIKYGVWSSTPNGNKKLNSAYEDAQQLSAKNSIECPVFLFFSANGTGHFCGVAEMVGPVDFQKDMDFWHQDKWTGSFPVKWHIIKDVPNSCLRQILLENNENRPVTHSRDTQEIPYTPGTNMLKIFKDIIVKECLLDDFMRYEEAEARNRRYRRFKLSYDAPVFVPVSQRAHDTVEDQQLKEDIILVDNMKETRDATEKLQDANLNEHQDSHMRDGGENPVNSISQAAKGSAQKESHSNGKQDHESVVKTATNQPPTSNGKPRVDGKQQYWKKVETPLQDGKHPDSAVHAPLQAPEKHPNGARNATVPIASGIPKMTHDEEGMIIGKIGSLAISSGISGEADRSSCSVDVVTIGSMPVRVTKSDE